MAVRDELGEEARLGAPGEGGCNHESPREVHAAPNKARHVCERRRVGEAAVSCVWRRKGPKHT
jgi:hypothetical protein